GPARPSLARPQPKRNQIADNTDTRGWSDHPVRNYPRVSAKSAVLLRNLPEPFLSFSGIFVLFVLFVAVILGDGTTSLATKSTKENGKTGPCISRRTLRFNQLVA